MRGWRGLAFKGGTHARQRDERVATPQGVCAGERARAQPPSRLTHHLVQHGDGEIAVDALGVEAGMAVELRRWDWVGEVGALGLAGRGFCCVQRKADVARRCCSHSHLSRPGAYLEVIHH